MNLPNILGDFAIGVVPIKIQPDGKGKGKGELPLPNNLPVLEKNHDWRTHLEKLIEESEEMRTAIGILDLIQNTKFHYPVPEEEAAAHLLEETLDVIQICIGVIEKVSETHSELVRKAIPRHIEKLHNRGWKFKKWLTISED